MEFRLRTVLKEIEADALRTLKERDSVITVNFEQHASFIEESNQAEELVHKKTCSAVAHCSLLKCKNSLTVIAMEKDMCVSFYCLELKINDELDIEFDIFDEFHVLEKMSLVL
jgi:hypothetical protein